MALNLRTSCETVLMIYGDLKKKKSTGWIFIISLPYRMVVYTQCQHTHMFNEFSIICAL